MAAAAFVYFIEDEKLIASLLAAFRCIADPRQVFALKQIHGTSEIYNKILSSNTVQIPIPIPMTINLAFKAVQLTVRESQPISLTI